MTPKMKLRKAIKNFKRISLSQRKIEETEIKQKLKKLTMTWRKAN